MAKLHITLGDKGGIGKSFIAALLAQYILDNMEDTVPLCLDLDPKNHTLSRYRELNVEAIDVRTDGDIDRSRFDIFVNRVLEATDDQIVIADVGGNIYVPMTDYLRVNEVFELMLTAGIEITLHLPIVGGGDLFPTLQTFDELMAEVPKGVETVVWINQKSGKVEYDGKLFEESERYLDYQDRIKTVCYIPLWRPDMQLNVAEMMEEGVTFNTAIAMDSFDLISSQRLTMARRYLYDAIEKAEVLL